jgi:cytochrome c-type biogenesis protein CcmH/NrfF
MKRRVRALLTLLAVLFLALPLPAAEVSQPAAPNPESIVGKPLGKPLSGPQLDAELKRVGSLVRCPVCQGLSVVDSPASMAVNMRGQVRELLEQGYTKDQILSYFEKSYGEFVLLEPPARGMNWIVWLAPLALLVIGGFVVRGVLGKKPAEAAVEPGTIAEDRDRLPDDPALARYVLRARELAYGWAGGVAPKSN